MGWRQGVRRKALEAHAPICAEPSIQWTHPIPRPFPIEGKGDLVQRPTTITWKVPATGVGRPVWAETT
jgi:hypothetical protein